MPDDPVRFAGRVPLAGGTGEIARRRGEALTAVARIVDEHVPIGGFRGILADVLWMRAGTLQDEGRYFELVQLSDWIAKLQPRVPAIWAYHAWNMAYNLSALMPTPAERWRWVRKTRRGWRC